MKAFNTVKLLCASELNCYCTMLLSELCFNLASSLVIKSHTAVVSIDSLKGFMMLSISKPLSCPFCVKILNQLLCPGTEKNFERQDGPVQENKEWSCCVWQPWSFSTAHKCVSTCSIYSNNYSPVYWFWGSACRVTKQVIFCVLFYYNSKQVFPR